MGNHLLNICRQVTGMNVKTLFKEVHGLSRSALAQRRTPRWNTLMEQPVQELVQSFTSCTLPRSEWNHHAHLKIGLWHVLHASPVEALEKLRDGIRIYNAATGIENTESQGYHETITRFYVWIIHGFLQITDRTQPIEDLAAELIARHGERSLPLQYYCRALLHSIAARLRWQAPDLRLLE
ncbi:hypothetical protein [Synechococcus sp. CBW1107]|uniref:hypothetical protein n=1 Tax=Synechococcus sp. CBW1107 TaxID=2789857 RepID=UPI002AD515BD|nr:hypothetical protein [Synechococcus sp. CBW1107]